jgi:hypothetical protein
MAADGGLGQLHNIAQFRDGEFIPVQNREHAYTYRVGEHKKLIDNCGRSIHPFSRMKGYIPQPSVVNQQRSSTTELFSGLTFLAGSSASH